MSYPALLSSSASATSATASGPSAAPSAGGIAGTRRDNISASDLSHLTYTRAWISDTAPGYYQAYSNSSEATVTFSFNGVAAAYFATKKPTRGRCMLVLDNSSPYSIDLYDGLLYNNTGTEQLIWYSGTLPYGRHNVTVSQWGEDERIGYYPYLASESWIRWIPTNVTAYLATASTPSPTPSSYPSSSSGRTSSSAVAGGVVGGLAAVVLVGFLVFWWRRRGRRAGKKKGRKGGEKLGSEGEEGEEKSGGNGEDQQQPPHHPYGAASDPFSPYAAAPYPYGSAPSSNGQHLPPPWYPHQHPHPAPHAYPHFSPPPPPHPSSASAEAHHRRPYLAPSHSFYSPSSDSHGQPSQYSYPYHVQGQGAEARSYAVPEIG
ncbi:hypothetical protein JCM8547_006603 [Rhodosporidiobolus lusitaniae]